MLQGSGFEDAFEGFYVSDDLKFHCFECVLDVRLFESLAEVDGMDTRPSGSFGLCATLVCDEE